MSKSELIDYIYQTIDYIRRQNYSYAYELFREYILGELIRQAQIPDENDESFYQIVKSLHDAMEKEDTVLIADLLEEGLLPILKEASEAEEIKLGNRYSLEASSSGFYTLHCLEPELYIHSNVNPYEEARMLVERCYEPERNAYVVFGLGLGYHIIELYRISRGSIRILIYEEDESLIRHAESNNILKELPTENYQLIHDPNGLLFADALSTENVGILMHMPSIKKIKNKKIRESILRFYLNWNSYIVFKDRLAINFRKNIQNCTRNVDELEGMISGKEVIVIGGGPSVDDNIDFLRENVGKKCILAVSSIYRRLNNENIRPDYIVIMDPTERTLVHIKGISSLNIPLIADSVACWEFCEQFQGEKYIAYQKGYLPAEEKASEGKFRIYSTGNTVVSFALDVAMQLGAKSVTLVGVDLAYGAGGQTYAEGTANSYIIEKDGLQQSKSVDGGMIYVNNSFINFRLWIEERIKRNPEIPVYNKSKHGALIEGTINV